MRKLLAAIMVSAFATAVGSGQSPLEIENSQLWFVELASAPTSDGTSVAALEREETGFHAAAQDAGIRYSESRHFRSLWNGLSVRAAARDVSKLRALPGVKAVYPVSTLYPAQDVEQPSGSVAELITALRMTGADIAQDDLGLSGRGVKVAVIDSGIDYDHPDLGGCFGPARLRSQSAVLILDSPVIRVSGRNGSKMRERSRQVAISMFQRSTRRSPPPEASRPSWRNASV